MKPHGVDACPLANASYCGLCASYGHSPSTCPDAVTRAYREPQYLEQLVPPSVLEQFNINTRTPLAAAASAAATSIEEERIWEVLDTDEGLRAALTNLGLKPMICQEKGRKEAKEIQENKRRLQGAADAAGYKVLYVSSVLQPKKGATK